MIQVLKEFLERNKEFRQKDLARLLGTSEQQLSRWLRGRQKISRLQQESIKRKLKIKDE